MNPVEELKALLEAHPTEVWDKQMVLNRNEYLKVKGSIDLQLYYIESGSVRVFMDDGHEEHTIRFGYVNSFIAALDCFLTEQPSEYYIQAIKKTQVKVIRKATWMEFIGHSGRHGELWQKILELVVIQQLEREKDLLTQSPAERYKRVLQRSPELFQEIPMKYIASYLRMTPETLSRIRKS